MVRPSSQRGSAIIMIFIAVALFGMLAYAFSQGSRTSMGWIEAEKGKATATQDTDCTNATVMALKRLQIKGCGSLVSYAADGSNIKSGAPSDGSCSLYHPNGGGIKVCGESPYCPLTELNVGEACNDQIVYVGTSPAGGRMYTTRCDYGMSWDGSSCAGTRIPMLFGGAGNTAGANSSTDGKFNTDKYVDVGPQYEIASYCRGLTIGGYTDWYLPAFDEISVFSAQISGFDMGGGIFYASSTETGPFSYNIQNPQDGNVIPAAKMGNTIFRCVRRD